MFIVMHCMGLPFNGKSLDTQSLGGSESAAYYAAREFAKAGHRVTLFTTSPEEGEWDGVRYVYAGRDSAECPLGENFHFYATCTPHDVCIIQRMPTAFTYSWASKINIWWLHDLALHRQAGLVDSHLWNIDQIWCVSEYHKKQVVEVYNLNESIVKTVTNGVDLALYGHPPVEPFNDGRIHLLYSSRPERGFENLVKRGGIIDQLDDLDDGKDYVLHYCCYENKPDQMREYYAQLEAMAAERFNVINEGHLSKQELANLMRACDLMVYPTEFEEVSCITMMEAMAAGLPVITTPTAALPETCKDAGVQFDGLSNFAALISDTKEGAHTIAKARQLAAANKYDWPYVAKRMLDRIADEFTRPESPGAKVKRLVQTSDIAHLLAVSTPPTPAVKSVVEECYGFFVNDEFEAHYEQYYKYESNRGAVYGPEVMDGNPRFECIADLVVGHTTVLDYGCAHGHFTVNLAKRFPEVQFIGIDITGSNIKIAREWAVAEGVANVRFYHGQFRNDKYQDLEGSSAKPPRNASLVIAAEVLEHVAEPNDILRGLKALCRGFCSFAITTPFGPWEAIGYREHWPWRAHIHHFERQDLHDMYGHLADFGIIVVPAGQDDKGRLLGSYVAKFHVHAADKFGHVNRQRKDQLLTGEQTLALCMLSNDATGLKIEKTIMSCLLVLDEVVIALDNVNERANEIFNMKRRLEKAAPDLDVTIIPTRPATEVGFSAARNVAVSAVRSDWILVLDDDETLLHPERLDKYLRHNQYSGYAIDQHHMSMEPAGLLKTDMPVRIFRNRKGISFHGMIHEHPEIAINEGVGFVTHLHDISIVHQGYSTEDVRRGRFARNFPLMMRDREEHPDRTLGKMLWVRDVAQLIGYAIEAGQSVAQEEVARAFGAIDLWEELLEENLRMATESLEYYSRLISYVTPAGSVDLNFSIASLPLQYGGAQEAGLIAGRFASAKTAQRFIQLTTENQMKSFDSKYL